jgi:hypothetical protein
VSTTTTRRVSIDAACADAVDLARAAAEAVAGPSEVGEHLAVTADDDRVVTHTFACLSRAYRGWHWAVTVARSARARVVTVDEVVLLPGPDALLPPAWVPWSERLKPGDLGVGDLLPTSADDDRLEQGYTSAGDADADQLAIWELGLGRPRVLSPMGRDDAADRWYSGDHGPSTPMATAAPATCATCGFLVLLAGSLRQAFGVCANEYSPSDGQVVSLDHGCGAHSEAAVLPPAPDTAPPVVDEVGFDVIALRPVEHSPGSVDDSAPGEDLGHS